MHQVQCLISNGGAGRAVNGDTAWGYRDANFVHVIVGVETDPANDERMIEWATDYRLELHPYSVGGGYLNMIVDEGEERGNAHERNASCTTR